MDQSIEIEDDVRVKIIDDVNSKYPRCLFKLFNVTERVLLKRAEAVNGLLIIIVGEDLL